jgi:hypothetical protein
LNLIHRFGKLCIHKHRAEAENTDNEVFHRIDICA